MGSGVAKKGGSEPKTSMSHFVPRRAAEFFAGIGLVRKGLEDAGLSVVYANDIEPFKLAMYEKNFSATEFFLGDISDVTGDSIPDIEVMTASFPCTDVSLAGNMKGLAGAQSGLFWQVARLLEEMGERKPAVLMLENVPALATSHGGRDLASVIGEFNRQGYWCDILILDAKRFVPQSRPRIFVLGFQSPPAEKSDFSPSVLPPKVDRGFCGEAP